MIVSRLAVSDTVLFSYRKLLSYTTKRAGEILQEFGCSEHEIELAQIAGVLHDIGNAINRKNHAEYGGLLAYSVVYL